VSSVRLEVLQGADQGRVKVLAGISVIGRDVSCAIVIAERSVSREHAVVRPEKGYGFVIEDLDSRSGTFVNGVRARKAVLQDGDTIRIGTTQLRVKASPETLQGEVPPDSVDVVKDRNQPTTRLTLDAVKFRVRAKDLSESGTLHSVPPSGEVPLPAPPGTVSSALPAAAREGVVVSPSHQPPPPPSPAPPPPRPDPKTISLGKAPLDLAPPRAGPQASAADSQSSDASVAVRLEMLVEIATSLATIHQPAALSRETARRVCALFPQTRRLGLFSLEEDPQSEEPFLRPVFLIDRSREGSARTRVQISHSVLQRAIEQRQAILSDDLPADFSASRSLEDTEVCSMVCVPLCLSQRVVGALYVDTTDAGRPFDEGALRLLTGVAGILASAFENSRLFSQVQAEMRRRADLERYFSPDLVDRVMRNEVPLARQGRMTAGTILFVDIRGFTRLTDITEPQILVATLNSYFAAMQRIIFRSGGTVERFGGDSILAYWGIMEPDPLAPARGARAAINMQAEVFRLNPELEAAGRPRLQIGVGVNSGDVVVGNVGSFERYEFTILGSAINLAKRLEGLAGAWELVVGQATLELLGPGAVHVVLPPTQIKGVADPVTHSALVGLRVDDETTPGERVYDLALPGQVDFGGGVGPTLAVGLEDTPGRMTLEVLTQEDPVPGTPIRLALYLPRSQTPIQVVGEVKSGAAGEETIGFGVGPGKFSLPSLTGVQRVGVVVQNPLVLRAGLGL
jgi:class 3 adenylate cyclase/pSer/pThr/pTyr-binding forkhead associated (FHA) protein/putative methionine-R-sulfoxide reductase with GAF domain